MREADQNSFEATQVEGELTHPTHTHFQLVDISLEAIDKFMRMMGIFGWTARSGVSTMPATFAYRSASEEYSPRQQSIFLFVAHPRFTCHERTLLCKQASGQSTHCRTTECTGTPSWRFRGRRVAGCSLPVAMDKAPPKETHG